MLKLGDVPLQACLWRIINLEYNSTPILTEVGIFLLSDLRSTDILASGFRVYLSSWFSYVEIGV